MTRLALLAAVAPLLATACDESQVAHKPDFSLARMQEQPRVDPFDEGMASPPPSTVPRGGLPRSPSPMTRARVALGRARFETICATCHGIRGDGESVVATKMLLRPPPSLLEARVRSLSDVQIDEVVARGYGLMPSYAYVLDADERAATVAYLRALQIAQGVEVAFLPRSVVDRLPREAP
jgi:mono/diheme cytochrome c family protein